MAKPGIIKTASLDFQNFRNKSILFNQIKKTLSESIKLMYRPIPEHRIRGLNQIHQLISQLSKDVTPLSKKAFEATQLDDQLSISENICNLLNASPPCEALDSVEPVLVEQVEKCLMIIQGLVCFCPETSEYFLDLCKFKTILALIPCKNLNVSLNALESTQCILATSPEHLRNFEQSNAIQKISKLAKSKNSHMDVRWKSLEFLWFYLLPEGDDSFQSTSTARISPILRSIEEKQQVLAQLLGEEMVRKLPEAFD